MIISRYTWWWNSMDKSKQPQDPIDPNTLQLYFRKEHAPNAEAFFQTYNFQEVIFDYPARNVKLKIKSERVCRFCQKKMPDVSFRNDAHIYPEFIGNRKLVSDFECDDCNGIFSKIENHLTNFLANPCAAGHQGKKKKGRGRDVSYTAPDNRLKIEPLKLNDGTKGIAISKAGSTDASITISRSGGETYIEYTKHSYIPLKVYKLLLKMGVCSLPESEMTNYPTLGEYLLGDGMDSRMNGSQVITIHRKAFGLGHRTPIGNLFKKRDKSRRLPTHIFVLMFANFVVEMYLPEHKDDIPLIYESGKLPEVVPILPPFFYSPQEADSIQYASVQYLLNAKSIVEKEVEKITMQYNPEDLARAHVYNPDTDSSAPLETFGETMKILLFQQGKITSNAQLKELTKKASQLGLKNRK